MQGRLFDPVKPAIDDIYKYHLPSQLYIYLESKNLLNHIVHSYQPEPCKKGFTIQVEAQKIMLDEGAKPDAVIVTIVDKDASNQINYAFVKNLWFCNLYITPEGLPCTYGNKILCPIDGLTTSQCAKQTPEKINTLITKLHDIISPGEQLERDPDAETNMEICLFKMCNLY